MKVFFADSNHFAVLVGMKITEKQGYSVKKNGEVKVLATKMMNQKKYKEGDQKFRRMCSKCRDAIMCE